MSPRGVAIPDVRGRLFDAAERVLARDGLEGLSSRAITVEAGTATGLLFRHFPDFDAFLAAFMVDRMERVHLVTANWVKRAGQGSVVENLVEEAMSLLPMATRLFEIVHARPSLVRHLMAMHTSHGGAGLGEIERSLAAYLEAERALGRVRPDADTGAVSLALAASIHEIGIRYALNDEEVHERIRRITGALVTPITAGAAGAG